MRLIMKVDWDQFTAMSEKEERVGVKLGRAIGLRIKVNIILLALLIWVEERLKIGFQEGKNQIIDSGSGKPVSKYLFVLLEVTNSHGFRSADVPSPRSTNSCFSGQCNSPTRNYVYVQISCTSERYESR